MMTYQNLQFLTRIIA